MTVLAFHTISRKIQPGINNYRPARFKRLLEKIIDDGYIISSADDYLSDISGNDRVLLTFDDALSDFHENALSILQELKLPALLFVPAGFIGRKAEWDYGSVFGRPMYHMTIDQLKDAVDSNIDIGSHGWSHSDLAGLHERALRIELERSKKKLEEITNRKIKYISYPFGRFNTVVERESMVLGYQCGFSMSYFKKSSLGFTIPRLGVYAVDNLFAVRKKLKGGILNRIERIKGSVINSFSGGTVLLNRMRSGSRFSID